MLKGKSMNAYGASKRATMKPAVTGRANAMSQISTRNKSTAGKAKAMGQVGATRTRPVAGKGRAMGQRYKAMGRSNAKR